jgi:MinD-like ATPase involved in chromosome partitioning or flagellar assembly
MTLPLASRFFTFYSFKGGVGRSMALLNCAYVLAGAGRRVLMIDFDLEAPGLTFLIHRRTQTSALETGKGLVELISEFVADPQDWPLARREDIHRLSDYITDLGIPESVRVKETDGRLSLIPAGRIDEQYEARLNAIDWKHPPLEPHRDDLFRHVRKMIEALDAFDYIFIGSRTGWSDEGYISSRILADHLVVLTGLNDQNIIGTARYLRHVASWPQEDRSKKRQVVLVESPLPEWEEQAKRDRHAEVQELFRRESGSSITFSHALPYHPRMALREEAMVADWPGSSLDTAYRRLTHIIQELAKDDLDRWVQDALAAVNQTSWKPSSRPDIEKARRAIEALRPIADPLTFEQIARTITMAVEASPKPVNGDTELVEYLARCLPSESYYPHRIVDPENWTTG